MTGVSGVGGSNDTIPKRKKLLLVVGLPNNFFLPGYGFPPCTDLWSERVGLYGLGGQGGDVAQYNN